MSELRDNISRSLKESQKAKEDIATSTLRLILAALKDRDIAARGKGDNEPVSDHDILLMLQTMVKQRRESITMYEQGGRLELAEQERAEIGVIERFLPRKLDDAEVSAAIAEAIAEVGAGSLKDMGSVMAALRQKHAGQMDFGKASGLVKTQLGALKNAAAS